MTREKFGERILASLGRLPELMGFGAKEAEVIPVVCFFGETSSLLCREMNRVSKGMGLEDVMFKTHHIRKVGKGGRWVSDSDDFLVQAAKSNFVVVSHFAAKIDVINELDKISERPMVLLGLYEGQTTFDIPDVARSLVNEIAQLRKR